MSAEPRFNVPVQLTGTNGNAFAVMGAVTRAIKEDGADKATVDEFTTEAMAGDYDHLLRVCMRWVHVQ